MKALLFLRTVMTFLLSGARIFRRLFITLAIVATLQQSFAFNNALITLVWYDNTNNYPLYARANFNVNGSAYTQSPTPWVSLGTSTFGQQTFVQTNGFTWGSGTIYGVNVMISTNSSGCTKTSETQYAVGSSWPDNQQKTFTMNISYGTPCGGVTENTNECYQTAFVTNRGPAVADAVFYATLPPAAEIEMARQSIGQNQVGVYTYIYQCDESMTWRTALEVKKLEPEWTEVSPDVWKMMMNASSTSTPIGSGGNTAAASGGSSGTAGGGANTNGGGALPPTSPPVAGTDLTNAPITWSNLAAGAARDSTLMAGFGAVVSKLDEIKQVNLGQLVELGEINSGIAGLGTNIHVSSSNSPIWMTNSLAGANTNYSQAQDAADTGMADSKGKLEDAAAAFGTFTVSDPGTPDLSYTFAIGGGSYTFDMSPDSNGIGWLFTLSWQLARWVLIFSFAFMVLKDAIEVAKVLGTAKQLSWPKIEGSAEILGTGVGGTISAIVIPVILVAVLSAMAAFLAVSANYLYSQISIIELLGIDPFSGVGGGITAALGLAQRAFPITLAFSLTTGYVIFKASLATAANVFVFVMRAIVGG